MHEKEIASKFPLHYLVWKNDSSTLSSTIEDNLQHLETFDPRGRTPLMLAVSLEHLECARILLSNGANVNVENNGGWTGKFSVWFYCSTSVKFFSQTFHSYSRGCSYWKLSASQNCARQAGPSASQQSDDGSSCIASQIKRGVVVTQLVELTLIPLCQWVVMNTSWYCWRVS